MSDEWTDWIEHDGKACPVPGAWVLITLRSGLEYETLAGCTTRCNLTHRRIAFDPTAPSRWIWRQVDARNQIIRYRVRKPRGLTILEEIARNVKAPEVVQ